MRNLFRRTGRTRIARCASVRSGRGGTVEFEGGVRGAGQGDGEGGAKAVGEAVLGGPGFQVVGQAGEEAEVGCRAGLEGEGHGGEEEHRGPRVARPWRGLRGMGEGAHGWWRAARGARLSVHAGQRGGAQGFQGVGCGR